jgi:glycosyltransferase involved in cell wall biosynthesis
MITRKRVLFVAHNFPPHGGSGVQRSVKFVKYLPEFGWDPVVLTSHASSGFVQDNSFAVDIPPDLPVFRVSAFSTGRLIAAAKPYKLDLFPRLLAVLMALPDGQIWWARKCRRVVSEIINQYKPDAVYTTSGPYSSHFVGLWAKQKFGLPWFADFRDPWSTNLVVPYPPFYRSINRRIERRVTSMADIVSCVSRPWMEDIAKVLGRDAQKFCVIPNGYDPDDIPEPVQHVKRHSSFRIVHMGSFSPSRRPDAFVRAVRELIQEGLVNRDHFHCLFVGEGVHLYAPSKPPFEVKDYVPHSDIARIRDEADVLLLILPPVQENRGNYSGKIYEYIASSKNVLAIVPEGGVAEDLLKATRVGVITHGHKHELKAAILDLYKAWRNDALRVSPDWTEIQKHTRKEATRLLSEKLDRLI